MPADDIQEWVLVLDSTYIVIFSTWSLYVLHYNVNVRKRTEDNGGHPINSGCFRCTYVEILPGEVRQKTVFN